MIVPVCEQIESDLYPPDSEFLMELRNTLEGFLKQPTDRTLEDIPHIFEYELCPAPKPCRWESTIADMKISYSKPKVCTVSS